ncbi:MAG: S1C family serine protease [bacterium]
MKPKIAPTSPKYQVENSVDDLYRRDEQKSFQQPSVRARWLPTVLFSVLFGLLAGAAGMVTLNSLYQQNSQWPAWRWIGITSELRPEREVIIREAGSIERVDQERQETYDRVSAMLVSIYQSSADSSAPLNQRVVSQEAYLGTGVLATEDGLVVLDSSLISNSQHDYLAVTNSGQTYPLNLVATDPLSDLGLGQIKGSGFPVVAFVVESDLQIGQELLALNSNNLAGPPSLWTSSLSSINSLPELLRGAPESSDSLDRSIQLSDSHQPWAAGTIVIDMDGAMVGMKVGELDDNLIFPVRYIRTALQSYLQNQEIERPQLGVTAYDLSATVGLLDSETNKRSAGALLAAGQDLQSSAVMANSTAQEMGLAEGDIIIKINDQEITVERSLAGIIQSFEVGSEVNVVYLRDGIELKAEGVLGNAL